MPSPVLGIDLGTTNSVVAHADETRVRVLRDRNGHLLTPSSVSFSAAGAVSVGRAARDLRTVDAEHTVFSVKRLIGRPFRSPEVRQAAQRLPFKLEEASNGAVNVHIWEQVYSLPEISAFILKHLRELAERSLGQPCAHAVITVPANFNELQRMATRDAGRIAGLKVLRILNEPTAAALAYGYRAQQAQRIAVYDFGGGTFDISILELSGDVIEVIATAGDTQLGGDDLDRAIADRMSAQCQEQHGVDLKDSPQAYERLTLAAEWIKCQLSERDVAEATIKRIASLDGRKLDLKFQLTRSEFHALCAPWIDRTFESCEDALRLAGVRPSQLDGVLLVGGQTRTPAVRARVREFFGMEPKFSIDPDLAVAHGAALQGYALGKAPSMVPGARTLPGAGGPPAVPPPAGHVEEPDVTFDDEPTKVDSAGALLEAERRAYLGQRMQAADAAKVSLPASVLPELGFERSRVTSKQPSPPVAPDTPSEGGDASDAITVTRELASAPQGFKQPPAVEQARLRPSAAGRSGESKRSQARAPAAPSLPADDDAELPAVLRSVSDMPPPLLDLATNAAETSVDRLGAGARPKPKLASMPQPPPPPPLGAARTPAREDKSALPANRPPLPPASRASSKTPATPRSSDPGSESSAAIAPVSPVSAAPAVEASLRVPAPAEPAAPSEFPPPPSITWVLLDVTPHTLCVETVGGYCETVIERNAPIPTEQTRIFTTSRDNQTTVSVRVCQGESRSTDDNQVLGHIELLELRPARRGEVNIAVTFTLDQDGTLRVRALDQATGKGQELRVNLTGAIDSADLERMRSKQQGLTHGAH